MKKLVSIALLLSISALSYSWDRASDDVIFGTRTMDAGAYRDPIVRGPMSTPESIARPSLYDSGATVTEPVVVDRVTVYPRYYDGYDYRGYDSRPVSGVVGGAATAAEGVVEGTAQAVSSLLP